MNLQEQKYKLQQAFNILQSALKSFKWQNDQKINEKKKTTRKKICKHVEGQSHNKA